jgi:serine dehydrogenase proteinase
VPGWGEILAEVQATAGPSGLDFDSVRRKYVVDLHIKTGRSTIVYASDFLNKSAPAVAIGLQDMVGLMEVFRDLPGPNLDLILHSPGGQAEATERLVNYMRSKFSHIRVFVPLAAMSAATMWALAADEIVMGKHSQLGPIDPQITLPSGLTVPAGSLLSQFRKASEECAANPARLSGWLPTLQQYPPGLLEICETSDVLARQLVAEWTSKWTFTGRADAAEKAEAVAAFFADDESHLSHSRAITRDQLRDAGLELNIIDLEDDPALQDAVLSVHHATMITFMGGAAKIIENNLGRAYVQSVPFVGPLQLQVPTMPVPPPVGP